MNTPTPQGPIRPDRSRFYAGRGQVASRDVKQETVLLGRKNEGEVKGLMRTLGRWAFIMRHPKIYLKQRAEDKIRRDQEVAQGRFQDTRHITDRKISIDSDHVQAVTKTMQSNLSKEGIGYDPRDDKLNELEYVQKVRAGLWEDVPGVRNPKSPKVREKLDKFKAEFDAEQAAMKARNEQMSDRFAEFANEPEAMRHKAKEYEELRQQHNEICDWIYQLNEDHEFERDSDAIITGKGRQTRKELEEERADLRARALAKKEELQEMRLAETFKTDEQRETQEVMTAVHNNMTDFMQTSQAQYDEMWAMLEKFPSLVQNLGGKDAAAKMARGDQLKQFRVDTIGGLEKEFVNAKGDEKQERELGRDIYAKRLMAMRMDEMIRATETPEALQKNVEAYTGKKLEPRPLVSKAIVQDGWDVKGWGKDWSKGGWEDSELPAELMETIEALPDDDPLPPYQELPAYNEIPEHDQALTDQDQNLDDVIVPPPPDFGENPDNR